MYVEGHLFEWTQEDANFLQPGIDRVRQFEGRMVIEYRVNLDRWMPGDFGTLDVGIIGKDLIVINDLKYGRGVPVDAYRNWQLMIYALGFWDNVARHETDARDFLIIIDQPRANGRARKDVVEFEDLDKEEDDEEEDDEDTEPAMAGEFRITLDELLAFGETVKKAAARTLDPDAPRVPSEKACRWCAAARVEGKCPEYESFNMKNLGLTFENLDEAEELGVPVKVPQTLTPARRTVLLRSWPMIQKWFKRMHAHALVEALTGDPKLVPGLKAVKGRHGKRFWSDLDAAEAYLSARLSDEQLFTKKLTSPSGAEKVLGKGSLPNALVEQGKPKPILVPVEDKRPALRSAEIQFDDLDDNANDDL
jgi:hypothetical protein